MGSKFLKAFSSIIIMMTLTFSAMAESRDTLSTKSPDFTIQEGIASYYGRRFHQRKTANGETFDMWAMTAAHKHLPFGTVLKVTNLKNGKSIQVRINDRLPKSSKRIIDLSRGVAEKLDMVQDGIVPVTLEVLDNQAMQNLKDYYGETKPKGIRIRVYEEIVDFKRKDFIKESSILENPISDYW